MANEYIKGLSENTNPDGTAAIEIDDGINSEYVQLNNMFNGAPTTGDTIYFNGTKWVRLTAGTANYVLTSGGAGVAPAWASANDIIGQKRLSLTSNTPVTVSDVTAATTVYWTDGTTNLSVAVPSTTVTPFDVFYDTSAGTLSTVDWTNDTTRATALVRASGRLAKTGDTAKIYLGTGRTTSVSGQCEDSLGSKRFIWNYYNRIDKEMYFSEGTNHTYTTASYRYWNNSSANRVEIVIGVQEDSISILHNLRWDCTAGESVLTGIGYDTNSTINGGSCRIIATDIGGGGLQTFYTVKPAVGFHYIAMVEFGDTTSGDFINGQIGVFLRG